MTIHLRPRIGTFLVAGTVLAYVWQVDETPHEITDEELLASLQRSIDRAVALGVDRTMDGDPAYGIRHLVDIGLRAVSPGINDPTTAVQCIDHATGLLVELAKKPLADGIIERNGSRAIVTRPDFSTQLELAQIQLLHYGGRDPWVAEALFRQLRDLLQTTIDGERRQLIERFYRTIEAHIDDVGYADHERRIVEAACEQIESLLEGGHTTEEDSAAG